MKSRSVYSWQPVCFVLVLTLLVNFHSLYGAGTFTCPGALIARPGQGPSQLHLDDIRRWGDGPHTEVTYSFIDQVIPNQIETDNGETIYEGDISPVIIDINQPGETSFSQNFPANAGTLIRDAFKAWESVCDIRFREVFAPEEGLIRIGAHPIADVVVNGETIDILGHGFLPGTSDLAGDLHFDLNQPDDPDPSAFTEKTFFFTALHEIGHSLGLNHILIPANQNVIMFPTANFTSINSNTSFAFPTDSDIAYIQQNVYYGFKIPRIESSLLDGEIETLTWNYPSDSSSVPAAAYTADIDHPTGSSVPDVEIINVLRHDLVKFELQSDPLSQQTIQDGAEDGETRIFDETVGDSLPDTIWERNAKFPPCTIAEHGIDCESKSYRIHSDQFSFLGSYTLPQVSEVVGTETSRLRFARAYFLADQTDQIINYNIMTNNGLSSITKETEFGINDCNSPQARSDFILKDFDLSEFNDQKFSVVFEFIQRGAGFGCVNGGVSIDNIELVDVLVPSNNFTAFPDNIPPMSSSVNLSSLLQSHYFTQMRAVFENDNSIVSGFSETALIKVNNMVPTVVDVRSSDPNGFYVLNDIISLAVQFSEPVNVIGTPLLELELQDTTRLAQFDSGSGSNTLIFKYTVAPGDQTSDLSYSSASALNLNGSTIQDSGNVNALISLPAPGAAGSLSANSQIAVDTSPPILVHSFASGNNMFIELQFDGGVFGDTSATTAIEKGDFELTLNNGSGVILTNFSLINEMSLIGGEIKVQFQLDINGNPNGSESITVKLVNNVFDEAGNRFDDPNTLPIDLKELHLNGEFTYKVQFSEGGATMEEVSIGRGQLASTPSAMNASLFLLKDGQNLAQDIRNLEGNSRWALRFDPPNGGQNRILSWEKTNGEINPDYHFFLQRLENEIPVGFPIDLSVNTPPNNEFNISKLSQFEILYGPAQFLEQPILRAGWNLVSIPFIAPNTVTINTIFGSLINGPIWSWNGERYETMPTSFPFNPERGYWIFSLNGGKGTSLVGIPTDGILQIQPNWNLIGTTEQESAIPTTTISSTWRWEADGQNLKHLNNNDPLEPYRGYWAFRNANSAAAIDLRQSQ